MSKEIEITSYESQQHCHQNQQRRRVLKHQGRTSYPTHQNRQRRHVFNEEMHLQLHPDHAVDVPVVFWSVRSERIVLKG